MAGIGDVVRRMDYQKRARNNLGLKRGNHTTKLQECSTFVRSANEHQVGKLRHTVRKMEADERLFRDVHSKKLSSVKKFHNTVKTKLTNFNDVDLSNLAVAPILDPDETNQKSQEDTLSRRGSVTLATPTPKTESSQKRRHSVQGLSSKYGRSFRKLRDAFTPSRVSPEPLSRIGLKAVPEHPYLLHVAMATASSRRSS